MYRSLLLTFLICLIGTVLIRHGPLDPFGSGERAAMVVLWLLGGIVVVGVLVAFWRSKKST